MQIRVFSSGSASIGAFCGGITQRGAAPAWADAGGRAPDLAGCGGARCH